jgi:hypothetical protein
MPWKNGNPKNYSVWRSMLRRCYDPKAKQYADYGGRGIKVCAEWKNDFKKFAADMGERPVGTSIERIDNNKNYCKENCKWATQKEQQRNRRVNIYVSIEGNKYLAVELAETFGIKTDTIVDRAKKGLPYALVTKKGRLVEYSATCRRGHLYTPENTKIISSGKRTCRECLRFCAKNLYRGVPTRGSKI